MALKINGLNCPEHGPDHPKLAGQPLVGSVLYLHLHGSTLEDSEAIIITVMRIRAKQQWPILNIVNSHPVISVQIILDQGIRAINQNNCSAKSASAGMTAGRDAFVTGCRSILTNAAFHLLLR